MAAPEATIISYGLVNPAPVIAKTILQAAALPGMLVHVSPTPGSFDFTDSVTDYPVGYTVKSTVPPTMQAIVAGGSDGTAQTGQFIGVQALIPGNEAYLLMGATIAVTCGDFLGPSASQGVLSPRTAAGTLASAGIACCIALENFGPTATAATVGSAIRVRIIAPIYLGAGVGPT